MSVADDAIASTPSLQSGLALAFLEDYDASVIRGHCARLAGLCDELVEPADPRSGVVCTFAFASDAGPAGVVVRRLAGDALGDRLDLRTLIGLPIAGVVRLDAIVRADAPETSIRVERVLTALAATLGTRLGGIACDDLGAVYSADELARLASASQTIFDSDTFRSRVAALAGMRDAMTTTARADGDVTGPATGMPPADALPDISTRHGVGFLVVTERLPLMIATRVLLAVRGAQGGNPDRLPVVVLAPFLAESDRAALLAIGASCVADQDAFDDALSSGVAEAREVPVVRATRERDEFSLFASNGAAHNVGDVMERRALDVALGAGAGMTDGPVLAETDASEIVSDLPTAVARFGFAGALASFYRARVDALHPFLRRTIAARGDVTARLGAPATDVTVCELVADPRMAAAERHAAFERADAYAVSIASELASDAVVVTDGTGALYGAGELARLTAARRGLGGSWTRRVATIELLES